MKEKLFFIRAEWDEEAQVWVATSDDVPGLVTEASNMEELIRKIKIMIPELLEANGQEIQYDVPFEVFSTSACDMRLVTCSPITMSYEL